jgi:predicted nucleic acid-binding protein
MELVVDANILVAGFLRSALTRELLLDERLILYAPEYSLRETERVLTTPRLRRKLGDLSVTEVRSLLTQLTGKIRILPAKSYQHHLLKAEQLAPHPEDAPYLALALHLNISIWSNDAGLKDQRVVPIYTTQELLEIL